MKQKTKAWYRIENKAQQEEAVVYIYDQIVSGDGYFGGVAAEQFVKDFAAIDAKTIRIRINSQGGSVFSAVAIHGAIQRHAANTIAHIDGLAASAASFVALAADEVRMAKGAMYMIHNAWFVAIGDKDDLREAADLLEKIDGTIRQFYSEKTGKSIEEISSWMDAETWFTADEALENGFVDELDGMQPAKAAFDLSKFKNVPAEAAALVEQPAAAERTKPTTVREMEAFLRDEGGFSNAEAKRVAPIAFKALESPRDVGGQAPDNPDVEPTAETAVMEELYVAITSARFAAAGRALQEA